MIKKLNISVHFPERTIRQERSRNISNMSKEELRICFPGEILFVDEINSLILLKFEECPVFGFAADFIRILNSILAGDGTSSFIDFYGEFEITLTVKKQTEIEVADTFRGGNFELEKAVLIQACKTWVTTLCSIAKSIFPELLENPHFIPLCDSFTLNQE